MRPVALILLASTFAAAPSAAQVYRWIDDRGVVNYGNRPPERAARLALIEPEDSRVSIIATPPPAARPAGRTPPAAADFPTAVDRRTLAAVARTKASRERCFAVRRVDCAAPTAATYD